jgi:hypothetical protein
MDKRQLSVKMSKDVEAFLAKGGNRVTVVQPNRAPKTLTAFVRVSPGSNGNRVGGWRLGSSNGRLNN